ncbi:hypothetical protein TWF696_008842 [Orbilia brochopaga]|uniref:NACHT domain-containing protein n=1 Tax=Orbilia brochopaga TaxID=3140254 RepID=A0AAV9UE53_9PEZI
MRNFPRFRRFRTRSRSASSERQETVDEAFVPTPQREHKIKQKSKADKAKRAVYLPPAIGTQGLYQLNDPNVGLSNAAKRFNHDIVAIHGLNGDIYRTWTKSGNFWLQDQLPKAIPGARIFSYGYPSKLLFSKSVAQIDDFAKHLLLSLQEIVDENRDILFICHSLGGIVFKQAMSIAYDETPNIWLQCKGVIFLGTPHRGSAAAEIAKTFAKTVNKPSAYLGLGMFAGEIRADLLEDLMYDSPKLAGIARTFQERAAVLLIYCFYESVKISGQIIVNSSSGSLDVPHAKCYPLYADHRDICRFKDGDSDNYKKVSRAILEMADELKKRETKKKPSVTLSEKSLDDLERSCMEQLNIIDITTTHQDCLEMYVEGILQWLSPTEAYSEWTTSEKASVLWVSGPPGCGKSVLSAYISELLSKNAASRSIVCRFFCNGRIKERHDPIVMLRSIIYQIVVRRRRLLQLVRKARSLQGPQLFQQLSGLWELLLDILKTEKQIPIVVVIDAIDECDEATQLMLVNRITKFTQSAEDSRTKFFITARGYLSASYRIPSDKTKYYHLDLDDFQPEIGRDVVRVIQQRLDLFVQRSRCTDDLRARLELSLASRAEKTFLWVSLVLSSLESKPIIEPSDLLSINKLPPTVSILYRQFLENIPGSIRKAAGELLRILVCSGKPLRIDEMNLLLDHYLESGIGREHPVYTDDMVKHLLYPFVRASNDGLTLIHQSVRDFLIDLETSDEDVEDLIQAFGVDLSRDSRTIARACMRYLLSDPFTSDLFSDTSDGSNTADSQSISSSIEDIGAGFGFDGFDHRIFADQPDSNEEQCTRIAQTYRIYDYASRFWTELLRHSEDPYLDLETQNMAISLFDLSEIQTANWLRYFWTVTAPDDVYPEGLMPISLASYFGHPATVRYLSKDVRREEVGISVYWASKQGNASCVEILLQSYLDLITNRPDICNMRKMSPLAVAAQHGHKECVQVLLDAAVFDINAKNEDGRTALSLAVTHGHDEIVSILLKQQDIDPNISDCSGSTALFWTTVSNSLRILSILLKDKRIDVSHLDKRGRSPLSWAAEEGQTALARKMVLDGRMDLNNRDHSGRTPFLWAVQSGKLSIVKSLIETRRVDTSAQDDHGRNALSWAAERNRTDIMHYLIKKCPKEVDRVDDQGWAPLAWSLNPPGYLNNALLLLQSGMVDINRKDLTGRTPLSFAVGWGYPKIAEAFLRFPGVDPNCVDGSGNTPIFDAVRDNNLDMIKVLIDAKGVDVNFRNKSGKTPLATALAEKKLDIVELLLSVDGIEKDGEA